MKTTHASKSFWRSLSKQCLFCSVSGKTSINDLDLDPGRWVHDPFDLQRMRTLKEILNKRPDVYCY